MPSLTLERFDGGLDRRKGAAVSDANRMRVLLNAYVTSGWHLAKRPGLTRIAQLEAGTVGLVAGLARLNTFFATAAVSHASSLFRALRLAHPSDSTRTLVAVYRGETFNGALYVSSEYDDGSLFHHYLDEAGAWAATTAYSLGAFREPTIANGFRYEVTSAGTSGGSEPAWPTTVGATVVDATVTWTCRSKAIADVNCPHHPSFVRLAQKIWSPGNEVVRYSATDAPRDWTTGGDAGFLPTGRHSPGDADPSGVGRYRAQLAVTHGDHVQTWTVDPDPDNHAIDQIMDVGSDFARTMNNVGQDLYFLSPFGFRSISNQKFTEQLEDLDVGSPVDELVVADLALTTEPLSVYFHGQGQYWCRMHGGVVWVFTYSRVSKVYAWSRYEFPVSIDAMAELENELYVRSGDVVYKVDRNARTDDGVVYPVEVQLPYLAAKKPGLRKQWLGLDLVMRGTARVSYLTDPDDPARETPARAVAGDTRANGMIGVGCVSTELGMRLVNEDAEDWELQQATLYYDVLGAM